MGSVTFRIARTRTFYGEVLSLLREREREDPLIPRWTPSRADHKQDLAVLWAVRERAAKRAKRDHDFDVIRRDDYIHSSLILSFILDLGYSVLLLLPILLLYLFSFRDPQISTNYYLYIYLCVYVCLLIIHIHDEHYQ